MEISLADAAGFENACCEKSNSRTRLRNGLPFRMGPHVIMLGAGGTLLAGLLADTIGRRLGLPRVTLLVLIGVAAGPDGRALIPSAMRAATDLAAALALTMVAFLLGSELSRKTLRRHGREILILSVSVVMVTALVVSLGLLALGASWPLALLLRAIAVATAPAATRDVVVETQGQHNWMHNSRSEWPRLRVGVP
jgi:NhaP-type Na+/H+ or K+/H+ antiporter